MGTLDQAGRAPTVDRPGFLWRLLSPIGAVLLALVLLSIGAAALAGTSLSSEGTAAILSSLTSLLLLVFGLLLWRGLPAQDRRLAIALKGSLRGAIGTGLAVGAGIVVVSGAIILAGSSIDPTVERRVRDVEKIGTVPWQVVLMVVALVVLAPLGEELLFRGLLLRALVRRLVFWPAAAISAAIFAGAHADSYLIWPRAIALVLTGLALAWLYRRRGYWASVTAHATVNAVAAFALVAAS